MQPAPSSDDPIGQLIGLLPQLRAMDISVTSNLYAFLQRRVRKLAVKVNEISPYRPLALHDPLGLNSSFPHALCRWLEQFPEDHRLGLLLPALSTQYVTRDEMELFREAATKGLIEEIRDRESELVGFPQHRGSPNFRVYKVSEFPAFAEFIHSAVISGTRDRDKQPYRETVEGLAAETVRNLRTISEMDDDFIYYRQHCEAVEQLLDSFMNADIVLLEDMSFSGTRIANSAAKLLQVLDVMFGKYGRLIDDAGNRPPYVYLTVLFGTPDAKSVAMSLRARAELGVLAEKLCPVFGFTFEDTECSRAGLPENLRELQGLLPHLDLRGEIARAVDFFAEDHFRGYMDDVSISAATGKSLDELKWGFGGKGWSIVTNENCPNDSLPILWYPHTSSSRKSLSALFSRSESHETHANQPASFAEDLAAAKKDKSGRLRKFLIEYFEGWRGRHRNAGSYSRSANVERGGRR